VKRKHSKKRKKKVPKRASGEGPGHRGKGIEEKGAFEGDSPVFLVERAKELEESWTRGEAEENKAYGHGAPRQ